MVLFVYDGSGNGYLTATLLINNVFTLKLTSLRDAHIE